MIRTIFNMVTRNRMARSKSRLLVVFALAGLTAMALLFGLGSAERAEGADPGHNRPVKWKCNNLAPNVEATVNIQFIDNDGNEIPGLKGSDSVVCKSPNITSVDVLQPDAARKVVLSFVAINQNTLEQQTCPDKTVWITKGGNTRFIRRCNFSSYAEIDYGTDGSVGGIAELPDLDGTPLESDGSSGLSAGGIAGITAGVAALAVALTGGAWYVRRRVTR